MSQCERQLFPVTSYADERPEPDWVEVHRELKASKAVTLHLLWLEYKALHPGGYQYTWFCDHYRAWRKKLDVVMRQTHRAGDQGVDYAGQTVSVTGPATGELRQAQIFVAVLGASNYTYCEATWTQSLPDWIASHQRAFQFFGGTPELVVPDNLKSGVDRAHRYEPDLNATYAEMATHYGTVIMPARVRKPRDKVEAGVLLVERCTYWPGCVTNSSSRSPTSTEPSVRCSIGSTHDRSRSCPVPGARSSTTSTGPRSKGCPWSPTALPSGST